MNRIRNMLRFRSARVLVAGTLLAGVLSSTAASSRAPRAADLLSGLSVMQHIRFLASDELQGRGNGTPGLERAAEYIAGYFHRLGLEPAGEDGTYFQPFRVDLGADLGPKTALALEAKRLDATLVLHRDYEPMTFSGLGEAEAGMVFVGYGITAPEQDYDDYADVDVRGKVVLMLRHAPREASASGPFEPERDHATFVSKAENALAHGAVALLLVNDPLNHAPDTDPLMDFGENLGADEIAIPSIHLKRAWAEKLFAATGRDLLEVQKSIDETLHPDSFPLSGVNAHVVTDINRRYVDVRNVLAYLPPSRRTASEEYLIIGGHYDHLGLGDSSSRAYRAIGQIHNGADDNASGTAGVLELARVFATRRDLDRGILFATFAGEELGLRGSRHYTAHPRLPLQNAVAMLNLDMIGRLRRDQLYVGGVDSSPVFEPCLDELAKTESLSISYGFSGYGQSDHTSFALKGVPSLFFFTGLHADYHKPSDDWQLLSPAGIERVLRLAYGVADELQALPERPLYVQSDALFGRRAGGGGGFGAYFGAIVDTAYRGDGIRVNDVAAGGPAAQAGLIGGDILVELDGKSVSDLGQFAEALRRHRPDDEVLVKIKRGEELFEVRVTLTRRP